MCTLGFSVPLLTRFPFPFTQWEVCINIFLIYLDGSFSAQFKFWWSYFDLTSSKFPGIQGKGSYTQRGWTSCLDCPQSGSWWFDQMDVICRCDKLFDTTSPRGLSCRLNVGRFMCQMVLNLIFKKSLAQANIPPPSTLEPLGLSRCEETCEVMWRNLTASLCNPGPGRKARCLVRDVTVSDSLAFSHILTAVIRARFTASAAEWNKILKYGDLHLGSDNQLRDSCHH